MARKLRVEYEGAIYHVMNRGDGGEAVFRDDEDRHGFVRALGEACEKTGWQVHAYCLMTRLRAETTVGMGWIAERLLIGSRQYVTQLLYQERRARRGRG